VGTVSDKDAQLLPDAVVTIVEGVLAGATTRSNAAGRFEFRGGSSLAAASKFVTLSASREGFRTETLRTAWRESSFAGAGINFFLLGSLDPPLLEPGLYTLTLTADLANARGSESRPNAPCAGFPSDLASRSYLAEIKQMSRPEYYTTSVTAEDPTLRWHDLISFYVSGSYVGFFMEGELGGGIYEDLPGFRYLQIGGSSNAQPAVRSGSSVAISFTGAIAYCQLKSAILNNDCSLAPADQIVEAHVCIADRNTLVFTKR